MNGYDPEYADVWIIVGDVRQQVRIPAHRCVLASNSPVFKAAFKSEMKEGVSKELIITDYEPDVVISFVRCIYNPNEIDGLFTKHGLALLYISHKYSVNTCIAQIGNIILSDGYINDTNVMEMLDMSRLLELKVVEEKAFHYINHNRNVSGVELLDQPTLFKLWKSMGEKIVVENCPLKKANGCYVVAPSKNAYPRFEKSTPQETFAIHHVDKKFKTVDQTVEFKNFTHTHFINVDSQWRLTKTIDGIDELVFVAQTTQRDHIPPTGWRRVTNGSVEPPSEKMYFAHAF